MKSTTIAITLLAAGASAFPQMAGKAMSKRGQRGSAGPMGNSGYSAPVAEDVKTTCLQAHNDGRAAYGVPPLRWNDELAQSAQGWANNIGSNMEHSGHNGYGENLAWNTRGDMRQMVLSQWFDECNDYSGGFSEAAGHYSQCVWRATTDVGCGYNSDNMLVCQYYPAGNMDGEYQQNVPQGHCINAASLPAGSGGQAPAPAGPGYGGSGSSPAPATPGYGGSGAAPAPANPGYGGGQAPAPAGPGYGGQGPSHGGQGPSHGGRPKPRPKPQPKPDCDEEDQSPQHGGHGGHPKPRPAPQPVYHSQAPSQGERPHGGHGGRPRPQNDDDCDDEDQSPNHGGHGGPRPYGGGMGSGPSHGGDYGNQGPSHGGDYDNGNQGPSHGGDYDNGNQGPSRGGNGGYGGRGSSGGHGGNDDDCED